MAEMAVGGASPPSRGRRLSLGLGLAGAVALGAGGFWLGFSGRIGNPGSGEGGSRALPDIAFVAIDPLLISLPSSGAARHLRFAAQLEVETVFSAEVASLMPRIVDVLNGYLRAVDARDLESPQSLVRLRAQMLRRVQIVTGEGRVRDLLITEFVMS